ncbi:GRAM domain-containing protein 2B-like isoform X2 [Osmerus eperlanus]|uniref:GRAM domain-containing protein 2B-like isoform X2 n=1 Tax=Osmerus eperlanus TaxID=29151 RepID=UPI002E15E914
MSFKNRRFSLDSFAFPEGGGGLLGVRRSSKGRRSSEKFLEEARPSEGRTSLGEARPDVQELGRSLSKSNSIRSHTIEEEGLDRGGPDGVQTYVKHNKSFHKLFQDIPEAESLTHVFTCALQKEVLYHGKLFVSENFACFHSSVLLKETKVVLHVSNIKEVKQKSALSMLSIRTTEGEKHSFVSLRNREVCYKLLQSVCPHTQVESRNSSPHVSSAENSPEPDMDTVSSHSSLEGSSHSPGPDHRVHGMNGSTPRSSTSRELGEQISDQEETGDLWVQNIKSFLPPREISNLNTLIYIFLLLVILLLLSSGYIGLRISALEEQLSSLGALSELSLHHTEYKKT